MPNSKIKACVIGLGNIGFDNISKKFHRNHCDNYFYSNHFSLAGASDINKSLSKKFINRYKHKSMFFDSINEMLHTCNPKIISICVPPNQTYKVLKKIKNINKYFLFLEKPIANNNTELKNISKILQKSKNKVVVNYFRSWDQNNLDFITKIKKRNCNEVIASYSNSLDSNASHIIYMLIQIFGKKFKIQILDKEKKCPTFVMYFEPNIKVIINGIRNTKNNFCEISFITENEVLSFESAGCRYTSQKFNKNIFYKNYYQLGQKTNIFKEQELNVFGNISKIISKNIRYSLEKNFSNFSRSVEVTKVLNYIKSRL